MPNAECSYCGEVDVRSTLLNECNYCNRLHCSEHILPENHNCTALGGDDIDVWIANREKFQRDELKQSESAGSPSSVTPEHTVGSKPDPEYPSSPPVEVDTTSNRSGASTNRQSSNRGLKLLAGVAIAAALLAVVMMNPGFINPESIESGSNNDVVAPAANATQTPEVTPTAVGKTESPTKTSSQTKTPSESRVAKFVHVAVNERRQEHELDTLNFDSRLAAIADDHAAVMARELDIFHTQPDGDTREDRYEQAGYDCRIEINDNEYVTGGENVAQTWYRTNVVTNDGTAFYDTPRELANGIVSQWMNSSGHRENILRSYWNNQGIGIEFVWEGDDLAVYVVQDFC